MELWYTEKHTPDAGITIKCRKTLFSRHSDIQRIDVLETKEFGRMLLLDGLVMTTERDEFFYHEMLVHPAVNLSLRPPGEVLVIGGGDGGAVRELMKYPSIRRIVLCEIDPMVVEVSREFLPGISCALSENDRLEMVFMDGEEYVGENEGRFDLIIVDSSDPIGAAEILFTEGFYKKCLEGLSLEGIMVVQSESPIYHLQVMKQVKHSLISAGFSHVRFYTAPVPTYPGGFWSWAAAFKNDFKNSGNRFFLPHEEVERLKFFTPDMLRSCFVLPAFLKRELG